MIANAGIGGGKAIEENSTAAIKRVSRINLEVPMLLAAAAREQMLERGSGQIVLISSLAGKALPAGSALYAATKAGLRGFALALRADLHDSGVGVTSINPGFVREAGMFHDSGAKPPPGIGTASPEDVGRAVRDAIENDSGRDRRRADPAARLRQPRLPLPRDRQAARAGCRRQPQGRADRRRRGAGGLMEVSGKTVLLTGATGGLGRAIAASLPPRAPG